MTNRAVLFAAVMLAGRAGAFTVSATTYEPLRVRVELGATVLWPSRPLDTKADALKEARRRWGPHAVVDCRAEAVGTEPGKPSRVEWECTVRCGCEVRSRDAYDYYERCPIHRGTGHTWREAFADAERNERTRTEKVKP